MQSEPIPELLSVVPAYAGRRFDLMCPIEYILASPDIGADAMAVFVALARFSTGSVLCHSSQSTPGTQLRRSRPWSNARITRPEDLGAVAKGRHDLGRGGETSRRYRLPLLDVTAGTPVQTDEPDPRYDGDTNRIQPEPANYGATGPGQPAETNGQAIGLDTKQRVRRIQQASSSVNGVLGTDLRGGPETRTFLRGADEAGDGGEVGKPGHLYGSVAGEAHAVSRTRNPDICTGLNSRTICGVLSARTCGHQTSGLGCAHA